MDLLDELRRIEAERAAREESESFDGDSVDYLQSVYRDSTMPRAERLRAAMAAAPYERPKLAVVANVSNDDLAARLEYLRRHRLTAQPPVIEHKPAADGKAITPVDAPFTGLRRG